MMMKLVQSFTASLLRCLSDGFVVPMNDHRTPRLGSCHLYSLQYLLKVMEDVTNECVQNVEYFDSWMDYRYLITQYQRETAS